MLTLKDAMDALLNAGNSITLAKWNIEGLDALCRKDGGMRAFAAGIAILASGRIPLTMQQPGLRTVRMTQGSEDLSPINGIGEYIGPIKISDGDGGIVFCNTSLPSWELAHLEARNLLDQEKTFGEDAIGGLAE